MNTCNRDLRKNFSEDIRPFIRTELSKNPIRQEDLDLHHKASILLTN